MGNITRYKLAKVLSCVMYFIPMGGLFAVNHDAYISTSNAGYSIGFFGIVLLAFIVIAFKKKLLDSAKKNILLSMSVVVFVISLLMYYLAIQLALISGASIVGSILAWTVEPIADVYYARSYEQISEERRVRRHIEPLPFKKACRLAYGFSIGD